ncbi:MAG TPA: alpha/beta hydrolase [Usitatibacter sp.]|nr:alpha/beta hydrolase [Usitatibacter sp.]
MAFATLDGIATRYEVVGSGPPVLMFSPGGFDATLEKWSSLGIYARIKPVEALSAAYRCIIFDRRECGQSGGRVEAVSWTDYVRQGAALLDHLRIDRAFLMGGCMGCSPVAAFAVQYPQRVLGMVLYWPVGGAKYRIKGQGRFAEHLDFVRQAGLTGVVDLVAKDGKAFGADPRGGPWASVIKRDPQFAADYAKQDAARYAEVVSAMAAGLLDRDTAPGAEPEELLRCTIPALVVPGRDESHATSAARYFEECLPRSQYWDAAPEQQTEATAPPRILQFLEASAA